MNEPTQDRRRSLHPPRIARWLLVRALARRNREYMLGDLEEDFHVIADSHVGYRGARRWYWRQLWRNLTEPAPPHEIEQVVPNRAKGAGVMETFLQDVKFALRTLRKSPGFTVAVVLTLALGIGANTAIFSVADAVLFRTLPVPEPERLVNFMVEFRPGSLDPSFNYPLYADYRDRNEVFTHLGGYVLNSMHLSAGQESERIRGMLVTGNYFEVLGVRPALGRSFASNEGQPDSAAPVAVISHSLWQRRFAGHMDVLGKHINVIGRDFTIIGVMPREFTGNYRGLDAHIFLPMTNYSVDSTEEGPGSTKFANPLHLRTFTWMEIFGRLKPGVTRQQAQERMRALAAQIRESQPVNTETNLVLIDGSRGAMGFVEDLAKPLKLLQFVVAMVLLIACANVANLLIARAVARRREVAVRLALGAGRGRLLRQMLTESAILAALGGATGLLVAVWLTSFLRSFRPALQMDTALNSGVLLFALGVTLLTGLLFGLTPAWQATRTAVVPALKEAPRTGRARRFNLRSALVVTQMALSLVVLAAAGLAVKSLRALHGIDSGLDTERVMLFALDVGRSGYDPATRRSGYTEARGRQVFDALLERVRTLPGVESAALATIRPLTGGGRRWTSLPEGQVYDEEKPINLSLNGVTPGYFATMGVPLLRGRDFDARDNAAAPRAGIVNETLVQHYWPGESGVGKHIQLGTKPDPKLLVEVVGVVRDSKYRALTETVPATLYLCFAQDYEPGVDVVVRSARPADTIEPVRAAVRSQDSTLPLFAVRSLADQLNISLDTQRMAASLLSLFGGLALLLGAVGLYAVMAWLVAQRTREIGIRMALGARRADIFRMVVSQALGMVLIGAALGLAGAFAATRLMEDLLYKVPPRDPQTLVIVAVVLALTAFAACYIPARRATRVDPVVALRHE